MKQLAGALVIAIIAAAGYFLSVPANAPAPRPFSAEPAESASSLRVLWVGHSLLNARDPHDINAQNVLEKMDGFAAHHGLEYAFEDHTLFGAPLSLLWEGTPLSYERDGEAMATQRRQLLRERFDAMVITEGISIEQSMVREKSAYFLQQFACAAQEENPDVRIYLYESWEHLQGSDPEAGYGPISQFDWIARARANRERWDELADLASTGRFPRPGTQLGEWWDPTHTCDIHRSILTIPVASLMADLQESPPPISFEGRPLRVEELFLNPYIEWPPSWPTDVAMTEEEIARELSALPLRHPNEALDDVHPSELGVYFAALATYAVIYARSPEGLPAIEGLSQEDAEVLQRFVWTQLQRDPRTAL